MQNGGNQADVALDIPSLRRRSSVCDRIKNPDVNPFVNNSPPYTYYESIKTAINSIVLFPIRFLGLCTCIIIGWLCSTIALAGLPKDYQGPLSGWRWVAVQPIRFFSRLLLFFLGFIWIKTHGRPAKPSQAPIVVSNHVTLVETIYFLSVYLCAEVADEENLRIPLVGTIVRALQMIMVDRKSAQSRSQAAAEIKKRALAPDDWPQLIVFPEGATTNGTSLMNFKPGAFAPGLPVQPVSVRYRWRHFDPSWATDGPQMGRLGFRMMTQFYNTLEVTFFQVYEPSTEEQASPALYAENVRRTIAKGCEFQLANHAARDQVLLRHAIRLGYRAEHATIELNTLAQYFTCDLELAREFLDRFAAEDNSRMGRLTQEEFEHALDVPRPGDESARRRVDLQERKALVMGLFRLLQSHDGTIGFREYLVSALAVRVAAPAERDARLMAFALVPFASGRIDAGELSRVILRSATEPAGLPRSVTPLPSPDPTAPATVRDNWSHVHEMTSRPPGDTPPHGGHVSRVASSPPGQSEALAEEVRWVTEIADPDGHVSIARFVNAVQSYPQALQAVQNRLGLPS